MKAAFVLFLVLVLVVAALQADAKPMNLQGRRLADASTGRKANAGSSDATVSSTPTATTTSSKTPDSTSTASTSSTPTTATTTSSKTPDSTSTASASSTPTTATTTGNTDAKTAPQREKNDGFNTYSSTPVDSDGDSSHHFITGP